MMKLPMILAALSLAACARTPPSETTCFLESSLTQTGRDAVFDAVQRWETATNGEFTCAHYVTGDRAEMTDGTIAFRMGPIADADGKQRFGLTYQQPGVVRATVTLAPSDSEDGLASTATHEIGHALCLNHVVDGDPSVMFADHQRHTPIPMPRDVAAFRSAWK